MPKTIEYKRIRVLTQNRIAIDKENCSEPDPVTPEIETDLSDMDLS